MTDRSKRSSAAGGVPNHAPGTRSKGRYAAVLRVSSLGVAGILCLLMVNAVVPPLVADQSDRAVIDAPVALLTSPIDGEIDTLPAMAGEDVQPGAMLAQISNKRLDRTTLISLQQKAADSREKLAATRAKRQSDQTYLNALDAQIAGQTAQIKAQFASQISELQARVAESESDSGAKKALVDRQSDMVSRNAASMDMLRPTIKQFEATTHRIDAEKAKLTQKTEQATALDKGIYVGDDLVGIAALAQKRRDIDLDAQRLAIEEKELSGTLGDLTKLIDAEQTRLDRLSLAKVTAVTGGRVLRVGANPGRHVNAGDSIASLVECDRRFVVAIFSYRQGQSMKVGTRVNVDGGSFGAGVVTAVLPKTSDKIDERFAIPFPQTERRELYAVIAPAEQWDPKRKTEVAERGDDQTSCGVGQWVTVTKANAIIPSMSVTWRRIENLVLHRDGDQEREKGKALLAAAYRSKKTSAPDPAATPAKAGVSAAAEASDPASFGPPNPIDTTPSFNPWRNRHEAENQPVAQPGR